MRYPYDTGEHDIPPGVTVCYVKDMRTGQIVRDGMHIDHAEALADGMNEDHAICGDDEDDPQDDRLERWAACGEVFDVEDHAEEDDDV